MGFEGAADYRPCLLSPLLAHLLDFMHNRFLQLPVKLSVFIPDQLEILFFAF
jgi:hypothetical protein